MRARIACHRPKIRSPLTAGAAASKRAARFWNAITRAGRVDRFAWFRYGGMSAVWSEVLQEAARSLGISFDPVPVRGWLSGSELVACVRSLGGSIRPATPFYGWTLSKRGEGRIEPLLGLAPELLGPEVQADDFVGVVVIDIEGEQYLALRSNEQCFPGQNERACVLAGKSLQSGLSLASKLKNARDQSVPRTAPGLRCPTSSTQLTSRGERPDTRARVSAIVTRLYRRILASLGDLRPDAHSGRQRDSVRRPSRHRQDPNGPTPADAVS